MSLWPFSMYSRGAQQCSNCGALSPRDLKFEYSQSNRQHNVRRMYTLCLPIVCMCMYVYIHGCVAIGGSCVRYVVYGMYVYGSTYVLCISMLV